MKKGFTIAVARPKPRLRYAKSTQVRPGKRAWDRRGAGKWRPER